MKLRIITAAILLILPVAGKSQLPPSTSKPATYDANGNALPATIGGLAPKLQDGIRFNDGTNVETAINGKQPLDSDLTAVAALATDSFGLQVLTKTTAAALRSYIGAGTSSFDGVFASLTSKPATLAGYGITDAQSLDATLTALAGLSTVADKLIYATGSDAFATTTLTSYARTILDDADASTMRSTLVLGTLATQSGTFSGTSSGTNTGDQTVPANTTGTSTQFFSAYNSATGAFTKTQPTFTDLNAHPTTLLGYGIVDAQGLDSDLTSIAALTTNSFGRSFLTLASTGAGRTYLFDTVSNRGLATDIYLSASATVDGDGTPESPRKVSTAAEFDALMLTKGGVTNIHWHFAPGTYQTNCITRTWTFQDGWWFHGSGMYDTTIQAVGSATNQVLSVLGDDSTLNVSNVVISDMTLDFNAAVVGASATVTSGQKAYKGGIASIGGSNNTYRNVRGIHQYGSSANNLESFGLRFYTANISASTNGNLMEGCLVELPTGTYSAPYSFQGWNDTYPMTDSKMAACKAIGINDGLGAVDNSGNPPGTAFISGGVNLASVSRFKVSDSTFIDCESIIHHDTGAAIDVEVIGNTLTRGYNGINSNNTTRWTVSNNKIQLQLRNGNNASIGIYFATSGTDITIFGNTITSVTGGGGVGVYHSFVINGVSNVRVLLNTSFDDVFGGYAGTNITLFLNHQPDGSLLTGYSDNSDLGFASGISTFLGTPSSANFRGAVTDESGTGALLFAGGNIGAATATSLNGLTITSSTGTLSITNGKTVAFSNSLTFSGTDGSTLNIGTGGTLGNSAYITLGSNVGTFLSTPNSANLLAALTDETGTGSSVFATAPSIIGGTHTQLTNLSVASSGGGAFNMRFINTEALTANRSLTITMNDAARTLALTGSPTLSGLTTTGTGVLATTAGKTQTFSNTLTFNGTDGSTVAFGAGGTVLYSGNSPQIVASGNVLAATATNASVATYTTPNDATIHSFEVGGYVNITAISAGTLTVQIAFTDENNAAQTLTYFAMGVTSSGLTTTGFTGFAPMYIRAKNNTAITFKTSFTGVSITYDVGGTITSLY